MHFLIYFLLSVFLICIQTTLIAAFPSVFAYYDLMIPFVVYLILFRSTAGIFPGIFIAGAMMDLMSGGYVGVYVLSYFFMLLCFRNATIFFHFKNSLLFQIIVGLSVLIENLLFTLIISFQSLRFQISLYSFEVMMTQLFWAMVSSILIYFLLDAIFKGIDQFITGGSRERVTNPL